MIPELAHRYGVVQPDDLTKQAFLPTVAPKQAMDDVLVQTAKLAGALTSGVFSAPLPNLSVDKLKEASNPDDTNPKYRISPRMIKHAYGKSHAEFCTGHQQVGLSMTV